MNQNEVVSAFQKIAEMARAEIDLLEDGAKAHGPFLLIEREALSALSKLTPHATSCGE